MSRQLIQTLTLTGLALSTYACGNPSTSDEVTSQTSATQALSTGMDLASVRIVNTSAQGEPTFIKGRLGRASQPMQGFSLASADMGLQSALPGVARLFQVEATDLFVKNINQDAAGNTFVRYGQKKNGLRVENAELLLHVDREGTIFAANGNARDGSTLSATPRLGMRDVLSAARAEAARSRSSLQGSPELVYLRSSRDGQLYLTYKQRASGGERDGMPVDDLLFVDAQSGAIVDVHPLIHAALNRKVYTAKSGTSTPGTLVRSEGGATSGDSTLDTNYDKLGETYSCYKNNFGRDSYDNAGATYVSTVHYSTNYVNAYWNGTQMVYGDGDNVNSTTLAIDADVTTHELTHAVTERTSGLVYSGQSGGLNEGMSDIFAAFCQSYKSGTWSTSNEVFMIGETIWTPGTAGDALRYLYDPKKDGGSLDYAADYTSSTDVHYTSGIPNLAFTLLAKGGTHPRGRSTIQVTGIGVEKAGHIFYETNTNCLTSGATYADAKTCAETKATSLYGATVAASVTQAWQAVGVGLSGGGGGGTTGSVLTNGSKTVQYSGTTSAMKCFTLSVPSGKTSLVFNQTGESGSSGDADLYVRLGSAPTTSTYTCRPYQSGSTETCTINNPGAGTWYACSYGYSTYAGVTMKGTY